jgi:hypothetical protein
MLSLREEKNSIYKVKSKSSNKIFQIVFKLKENSLIFKHNIIFLIYKTFKFNYNSLKFLAKIALKIKKA